MVYADINNYTQHREVWRQYCWYHKDGQKRNKMDQTQMMDVIWSIKLQNGDVQPLGQKSRQQINKKISGMETKRFLDYKKYLR